MNHLAHIFLSYPDEYSLTGNFLTDFLSISELRKLDTRLASGVALHRRIDEFTDTHSAVRACADILRPQHRKYTPVVIDIYFDYFLIQNWNFFSIESVDTFILNIYPILEKNKYLIPYRMHHRMDRMIESDFLRSCANTKRLEKTFTFLQQRTKFANQLHNAHLDLMQNEETLNQLFMTFFPELILYTKNHSKS